MNTVSPFRLVSYLANQGLPIFVAANYALYVDTDKPRLWFDTIFVHEFYGKGNNNNMAVSKMKILFAIVPPCYCLRRANA